MNKIGFRVQVDTCLSLPIQGYNRGHNVGDLLEALTASVLCVENRFMHTEVTRNDAALRTIFGWKYIPGQFKKLLRYRSCANICNDCLQLNVNIQNVCTARKNTYNTYNT